jgi:hypothetical protein
LQPHHDGEGDQHQHRDRQEAAGVARRPSDGSCDDPDHGRDHEAAQGAQSPDPPGGTSDGVRDVAREQLEDDGPSSAEALQSGFTRFLWGMLAIFLFSGIGNASTFKQMPMIFERRQAGGVLGWTAALAAFGPFIFGVGLTIMSPTAFYAIGIAYGVLCIGVTWWRYARPGAAKPS